MIAYTLKERIDHFDFYAQNLFCERQSNGDILKNVHTALHNTTKTWNYQKLLKSKKTKA